MIIANDSLLTQQYANIIYYYKHHAMQLVVCVTNNDLFSNH